MAYIVKIEVMGTTGLFDEVVGTYKEYRHAVSKARKEKREIDKEWQQVVIKEIEDK